MARDDDAALQMLADYAPRYARVAARAGLTVPSLGVGDLDVVETVAGTQTTDFGAPDVVAACDREPVNARAASRLVALLDASWEELDAVVASSPAALRKGPRGGGRDRDAMVDHVVDAERSYARKIGVYLTAAEWREGGVVLMRERIRAALQRPSGGTPPVARGWPPRYVVRRMAWHVLDHAWEMEDRRTER